jgi:PAS domain S-box-containing protein
MTDFLDVLPLPVILADRETQRITYANGAAEERYGYSRDQILGLQLGDLSDSGEFVQELGKRDLAGDVKAVMTREYHRRHDGSVFPVLVASRSFHAKGRETLIHVMTELSELRSHDAEQRFADKMDALARMSGGVAHEYNNLLTAILATTDLALAAPDIADTFRADLEQIRSATHRAARTTLQLMAFSGSQKVQTRPVVLNDLLTQLTPLMEKVVPDTLKLRVESKATGMIAADPGRLEQVILNLVMNAVEASSPGGTVAVRALDQDTMCCIVIEDSGAGMDEATLSRLFEPFHSTKGPGGGRGLGLASVYGTVRQMGGSVDIESNAGQGTRIRLFFERQAAPVASDAPAPLPTAATGPPTGGEVVLVVEDEPLVRSPICRKLRMLGYMVLEADNGEHAIKVLTDHHAPVHLVISDVMMPEMDGAELATLLRSWYPRLRMLFMSGYSPQYFEAQGGRLMDGAHFMAKPFTPDDLAKRVREILDSEWVES